jgi:hypothetical protein
MLGALGAMPSSRVGPKIMDLKILRNNIFMRREETSIV